MNWLERYRKVEENNFDSKILVGFNANIDVISSGSEIDLEGVHPRKVDRVSTREEFLECLARGRKSGNFEVKLEGFEPDLEGERRIGGQAGIISNFLSRIGNRSVFYTPYISEELAANLDNEVLCPEASGSLAFRNVSDAVNSEQTKQNYIVQFEESSSRVIFSGKIRGFGPYFRKEVEEKFPEVEESVDRAVFSGFHDAEGNIDSKLDKARKQMEELDVEKHLEFVSSDREISKKILREIAPMFQSIGLDENEALEVGEMMDISLGENLSLGEGFKVSKKLLKVLNLKRVHIHTLGYQLTVTKEYRIDQEKIRESMLYAGLSASSGAGKGKIPGKEDVELTEDMEIVSTEELRHFETHLGLEDFVETGIAEVDGLDVVAAPSLVHTDPKKTVGLGDIISSAAFVGEIN